MDPTHPFFITASAIQRAHLFRRDVIKRILVDSLHAGRVWASALCAFVIMPNHVHLILRCENDHTPGDIVRKFKKATANLILCEYARRTPDCARSRRLGRPWRSADASAEREA